MMVLFELFAQGRRASRPILLLLSLVFFALAGCSFDDSALEELQCTSDSDCQNGDVCEENFCVDGTPITELDAVDLDAKATPDIKADTQPDAEPDVPLAPTCDDRVKNGEETDVDCGGADCDPCANQAGCRDGSDCESGFCHEFVCQAASCDDGVQNGDETDIDCGGSACAPCVVDQRCELDTDCQDDAPGAWGACEFPVGDVCVLDGTRTRAVTEYFCGADKVCQQRETTESGTCQRDTNGDACGDITFGQWSACTYADSCTLVGEQQRDVFTPTCSAGTCDTTTTIERDTCSRTTDGDECGAPVEGPWSACDYQDTCSNSGTRTRAITKSMCAAGLCAASVETQTDALACERETNGDSCSEVAGGVCDAQTCVGCTEDAQCQSNTAAPYCQSNQCVECKNNGHCAANVDYPYCQSNQCVECKKNSHCSGDYVECKTDVNRCLKRCRDDTDSDCSDFPGTTCQNNWCLP